MLGVFCVKGGCGYDHKKETVMNIALEKLVPFRDHPFQVRDDEQMQMITESIRSVGVLVPAIARPLEDGSFELISGHRRKHACEVAGLSTLPVIVRDVDQDTATVMMVDSNFQREEILPSERAKAYKMKLEAIKRQGARSDLTSDQVGQKSERKTSRDLIAENSPDSSSQIQRYRASWWDYKSQTMEINADKYGYSSANYYLEYFDE